MPLDLSPFLDPSTTAVLALEVQENLLVPEQAMIPGVARHAEAIGLVDRLARLYGSARRVGAQMLYVIDDRRTDGLGQTDNLMIGRSVKDRSGTFAHGDIVAPLAPQARDIVIRREHGMTGFYTTPLHAYLTNLGITTLIVTGVSANIAVNGTAIEAMNHGYRVIVPSDAIAGDPPEYVEWLLRYTVRNVALVAPTAQILDHWAGRSTDG
jgi:nicotinamidase-related amidase